MSKNQAVTIPAYLEKRDGSFVATEDVLKSPELREQLTPNAKRQFQRVVVKLARN